MCIYFCHLLGVRDVSGLKCLVLAQSFSTECSLMLCVSLNHLLYVTLAVPRVSGMHFIMLQDYVLT